MVNSRLFQISLCFIFLLISHASFSSPQLILFIDKEKSTLGRPIRAELYGISLPVKISDLNLDKLKNDFGVVTDYVINKTTDNRWPNKTIQILKFKLYPRNTGTISIPSLSTNNTLSQTKTIQVIQGKTSSPTLTLSVNKPYERQQIIALVQLISHDSSARLAIKEEFSSRYIEATPLEFKRIQKQNGTYELTIGWALTALKKGQIKFAFPPIDYSVNGVSRKKFYLPKQNINIKALPSYLPPTIPIGKVAIKSHLSQTDYLQSNVVFYWNINVKGNHNNAHKLPAILRQIKPNENMIFFPADSRRRTQITNTSLTSSVNHSIPFKIKGTGFFELPEIQLQYFDPITNKIRLLFNPPKTIFVLSYFWKNIILATLIGILSYLLFISAKGLQRFNYSKNKRLQAIQLLEGNVDIEKIRLSTRLLADAEYWPKNASIQQWAKLWMKKYKINNDFENTINTLSSCIYNSKEHNNINDLSFRLLNIINSRKKL